MPDTLVADLFARRHLAVYRYFRRMTGSHDLAQDLTQELFLRVVRAVGAGTHVRSETGFLFQIAHHVLVDHWRHTAAAPPIDPLVEGLSALDPPQPLGLTFQEALNALPARDRETFVLREVEGLSYAEIATVHEATVESVRSRLRRARERLRHALGGDPVAAPAPHGDEGDL